MARQSLKTAQELVAHISEKTGVPLKIRTDGGTGWHTVDKDSGIQWELFGGVYRPTGEFISFLRGILSGLYWEENRERWERENRYGFGKQGE